MAHPAPVSVVLPTVTWNETCEEVAAQLRDGDELLVVCDAASDLATDRAEDVPTGVRIVIAGEPRGCSGKANAVAAGMEAARHDRIVWTDDDFHHPLDWLATLRADYERHGPVSELPVFVGRDPLAILLEPAYLVGGTLPIYLDDKAWAGAMIFDRADLDVDALLGELRRTVSDDGLLAEYLELTTVKRTRRVEIGSSARESLERHVRWMQIVRHHGSQSAFGMVLTAVLPALACLLFPVPAFVIVTLLDAAVYAAFGVRRPTFLLAYPAVIVGAPLTAYALARRTFVWGGRRYHWRSKFDVVVESV